MSIVAQGPASFSRRELLRRTPLVLGLAGLRLGWPPAPASAQQPELTELLLEANSKFRGEVIPLFREAAARLKIFVEAERTHIASDDRQILGLAPIPTEELDIPTPEQLARLAQGRALGVLFVELVDPPIPTGFYLLFVQGTLQGATAFLFDEFGKAVATRPATIRVLPERRPPVVIELGEHNPKRLETVSVNTWDSRRREGVETKVFLI